jgi:hypothetical protein
MTETAAASITFIQPSFTLLNLIDSYPKQSFEVRAAQGEKPLVDLNVSTFGGESDVGFGRVALQEERPQAPSKVRLEGVPLQRVHFPVTSYRQRRLPSSSSSTTHLPFS